MSKINIGCGTIHHPDWINLDVISDDPAVMAVDITAGLPFEDASVSVCYSSHVLEHLDKISALKLLKECARVLHKDGIIRLVVPDLETIAREYLHNLEQMLAGAESSSANYDWIMLELYDQVARQTPGGEMSAFLNQLPASQRDYVRSRIGAEADYVWGASPARKTSNTKFSLKLMYQYQQRFRLKLAKIVVRFIAGRKAAESFKKGLFRDSGEVHQWMYDRYSLKRLLEQAGYAQVSIRTADESIIPDFSKYGLDMKDGMVRKPDSLFIEAVKA